MRPLLCLVVAVVLALFGCATFDEPARAPSPGEDPTDVPTKGEVLVETGGGVLLELIDGPLGAVAGTVLGGVLLYLRERRKLQGVVDSVDGARVDVSNARPEHLTLDRTRLGALQDRAGVRNTVRRARAR